MLDRAVAIRPHFATLHVFYCQCTVHCSSLSLCRGIGALFNLPDLRELSLQGSGSRTRDPWPSPSKFAYPYLRIRTS